MNEQIKLIQPYISFDEVADELKDIFDSGQLTKGPHVDIFVDELKRYCNSEHAFLATSATTALSVCLKAVGIKVGDKVAISDFSFPATANVVEDLGAVPIFIDVNLDTFNMSAEDLEQKITKDIKAVIFVDAFGNPSGLLKIKSICEQYNIPLIEDAACAIGSSVNNQKIGSIADLTCFSFHPRKLLTTGEGGAILTNDLQYAEWLQVKLNHGASGLIGKSMNFIDYGYNFRLSEIQALMGWKQLKKLDVIVEERQNIAMQYSKGLSDLGFIKQSMEHGVIHNSQSVVFKTPKGILRDSLIDFLAQNKIESTIGTYCLSGGTYFRKKYNNVQLNSLWLEEHTLTLPCYTNVDLNQVIAVIHEFL